MRKAVCRPAPWPALTLIGVLLGATTGCQRPTPAGAPSEQPQEKGAPGFHIVKPERKTVSRRIEQPGFNIEAYQETSIYPRISGYILKWKADMGDRVKKNDLLADLYVPERVVAVKQKEAAVRQTEAQVKQAQAAILTAKAQAARARSQYERLARAGKGGVLDRESVEEARLVAEAAEAGLVKATADLASASAQVEVARADQDYAQTMLGYARLTAPFDGVVTRRNVSDGDFVQPAGMGAKSRPLYIVQQVDPVRVFVHIPGAEALWLKDGDPASFRLQGAGGEPFTGKVTRNARSLEPQARTLRTEIDVPNPNGKLLPGMYVQASIMVRHVHVWTLPASAVVTEGDQTFCYRVEGSKAVRTPLAVGLQGNGLVEVVKKQTKVSSTGEEERWEDFTGEEEVVSDPTGLSDGQPVRRS